MKSFREKHVTADDSGGSRVVPDFRWPIKKPTGRAGRGFRPHGDLLARILDFGNVSPGGIAGFRRPRRPGAGF